MSETIEEERERNLRWARETVKLIQEGADRDELIDKKVEEWMNELLEGADELLIERKEDEETRRFIDGIKVREREKINIVIDKKLHDKKLHEMTLYKLTVIVEKLERRVELLETNKN